DRSFVLGMVNDPDDAAVVTSIIDLARALGLRVVAEGVEDNATQRMLLRSGCEVAQGWHFARPMPADDLVSWLGRYRPTPSLGERPGTRGAPAQPRPAAEASAGPSGVAAARQIDSLGQPGACQAADRRPDGIRGQQWLPYPARRSRTSRGCRGSPSPT